MKENKKEKVSFLVSEGPVSPDTESKGFNRERLKKPIIFAVMGVIFAACLYLIFGGEEGRKAKDAITNGINDVVPQASGDGMPEDKGTAYEQEMRREKDLQKREALMTLSDYWHPDSVDGGNKAPIEGQLGEEVASPKSGSDRNPALGSYRSMQQSLGTFYQQDPAQEALRKENEKLKEQLQQQTPQIKSLDRLQLMEKSYQMAAKYFPGTAKADETAKSRAEKPAEEPPFLEVLPDEKAIVSKLSQKVADSVVLKRFAEGYYRNFAAAAQSQEELQPANSIRACIHQNNKVTSEGSVQIRLLQAARLGGTILPKGYIVTAAAKFQTSRLQLQVVSVEVDGRIFPVNLSVYDVDGQKGLNLPYSAEVTAVNGTLANMGNSAGGGITINRSAGQQLTTDAARGLIQGVSGYFSKKVKPQKATLRAGYQLFLVSKEK
jgi:conjugative transposon TraM protein